MRIVVNLCSLASRWREIDIGLKRMTEFGLESEAESRQRRNHGVQICQRYGRPFGEKLIDLRHVQTATRNRIIFRGNLPRRVLQDNIRVAEIEGCKNAVDLIECQ